MRLLTLPSDRQANRTRYILTAWLLALLPSLAFFALRVLAGRADLAVKLAPGVPAFAAYSILVAPLVETAVMLPIAAVLRRLPGQSDLPRIAMLAAMAAAAHAIQGGAWAAAGAFWPFLVYAACLFAWWPRSTREAFVVTAAVHALYNAAFLALGLTAGALASGGANPS